MSAALRHHKQQLHIGYPSRVGLSTATTSMNDNGNNNESNDDDDDDNHTNSSHCSLSDELHHHALLSSSELRLNRKQQISTTTTLSQEEIPQYPIGTQCKKYFHGHGWCSGEVIAFMKGRYKVRFDRPNMTTGTTTQKDICYEVEELPRLMKTASVIPGTRVEIYWPQERRYYTATIKTEQTRKRENYLICYDDARHKRTSTDREWIDLHRHKFRIIAQPPPEDDVVGALPVPSTSHTSHRRDVVTTAPQSSAHNSNINNNNELGHPMEVMIVQEFQETKLASHESGSISIGTDIAPLIESVGGATATTARTKCDESSQYMHLVSNVPSNHTGVKKEDVALDTSRGGTVASIEPPRTIVSMEMEEDLRKSDSSDVMTTHNFPSSSQIDSCSPGNSSACTNRSVVLCVPECDDVNVPRFDKSQNELAQDAIQHIQQSDQYSLRRVSQETMNDTNSKTQLTKSNSSSSSDNDTVEVEVSPRSKGKKIAMSIVDSDDSAAEKLSSNSDNMNDNDDEVGIVIDPDNDEATKTAICSLIHIGSRVAVYSEFDDQFFPGTVTDRKYRGKPFYIEYDDDEAEWIDLRKQRFRLLPSSTATLASSSIILAHDDSTALGTIGYRSTRRSSNIQQSIEGKLPNKQKSTNTSTANNHRDVSNMKDTHEPTESTIPTLTKVDSPAKQTILKRSERSTNKPLRFQELCDTTDSDEGMNNNKPVRRKKLSSDKKMNQADNDIAKITVGTRVAVWWGGDQQYYNAVVMRQRSYKKPFYIEYEGTDEAEWIDFRKNKFKILPPKNALIPEHEMDDHNTTVGTILNSPKATKVNSPKRFRLGSPEVTNTLDKNREADESNATNKKRKNDCFEETNLHVNDVSVDLIDSFSDDNNNDGVCNFITVGTRVSVYWEGDSKYYDGTVTRERKNAQKKHFLEYDDGEAAHWIDFREHWVRLLPSRKERTVANSNSPVAKKQKVENDVDATMPTPKRSLPDRKASASTKEVSKRLLKKAGSSEKIGTKIVSADKSKSKTLGKKSEVKLPKNGSAASTKKQKVEVAKVKASAEADGNPNANEVSVGTRVEVWWDGDARYYKGTVIKLGPNQNKKHFIRYDDSEEEWVYFANNRVRLLDPTGGKILSKSVDRVSTKVSKIVTKKNDKNQSNSADIASTKSNNVVIKKKITTTVEKTKDDRARKSSTKKDGSSSAIAKKDIPKKADEVSVVGKRAYKKMRVVKPAVKKIESESDNSDDSDASSLSSEDHYAYKDFVYGNVEKLKVGSRVSVWWSAYRRYFDGTIKKIDTSLGCRRPYFIKYDDNDKEWTDLRRRYFRFLD